MSNKFAAMSKEAMKTEGAKLMNLVQQTEISEEIQKLIKTECDKAFAKGDKCPVGIDIAFLFDVSGSMKPGNQRGWAWNTQEELIEGVVPHAMNYDEGGIDLWAIRTASDLERVFDPEIERKLNVKDPHVALQYVRSFENKLGDTPTRPLFNKLVGGHVKRAIHDPVNTKLLDIKVSTDGLPNSDSHPTMTATTEQAIIALHKAGLDPCRYLAVSYVIITDDFHTMCNYLKLEDRNTWGPAGAIEYDVANAMFPVLIKALGGFRNPVAVHIALGGAICSGIDNALELILEGPAKELMELMHAYNDAGYCDEV